MLKVLLGGIAGIATGYAIRKYLEEEECNCSHNKDEVSVSNNTNNDSNADATTSKESDCVKYIMED